MKSHLNETPFDELLGFHEECKRLVEKKYIKNKTVLDIGCGFGWCVWYLLNGGATRVKGIDISNELVAIARTIPDKRAEITVGSAIDLPYKKNTFDTVVSWETLEHIPKNTEPKMFRDVYKVLKPGGYFFFSTQHNNFFSTILDPAWWLIGHRHYSRDALIRFAETSGFTVEKIYLKGGVYTLFETLNMYFSKWVLSRQPLYKTFFYEHCREEYKKDSGFMNFFVKCKKPLKTV